MDRIEFGRYLLRKRNQLRLNLDSMAKKAGLASATLTDLERGGIIEPRDSTIVKAAKAYEIPVKMFEDVFQPDDDKLNEENRKADAILKKIQGDAKYRLNAVAGRNIDLSDHNIPLDVKKYIIHLYEETTGKKVS